MATSDFSPGGQDPDRGQSPPQRDRLEEDERRYRQEYGDRQIARTDDGVVASIIPYKNVQALLAYYFGVFSLIPCLGLALGPVALILGILGVTYVKKHPSAKGTGHAVAGIVLGSLTTLGNWSAVVLMVVSAAAR